MYFLCEPFVVILVNPNTISLLSIGLKYKVSETLDSGRSFVYTIFLTSQNF